MAKEPIIVKVGKPTKHILNINKKDGDTIHLPLSCKSYPGLVGLLVSFKDKKGIKHNYSFSFYNVIEHTFMLELYQDLDDEVELTFRVAPANNRETEGCVHINFLEAKK